MDVNNLEREAESFREAQRNIKRTVNYKGWTLLAITFLVGVFVGYALAGGL